MTMNARFIAASCGTIVAALACAAGAQTIEITSTSIGTVTVRPQPIDTRRAAAPATRAARSDGRSAGVDLGIRRNPDGSLHDALDPRQSRGAPNAPASALQDDVASAGGAPAADAADARDGVGANRATVPAQAARADFPYGVNGAAR